MCGETLTPCADNDSDHDCDICGEELTQCSDTDNDHKCDVCGETLTPCADNDSDHDCDICGEELTQCSDTDNDHKCDVCGEGFAHTYVNGICSECGFHASEAYTHAVIENQGVQNMIDRAYLLTDVEWTPLADVPGLEGSGKVIYFKEGVTYKGIPYSGVTANDFYVGLNVSLTTYLTALKNKNSLIYTENLQSTNKKAATYYGTVCSKFAQYALNVPGSFNTENVANIPGMATIAMQGKYTVDQIRLGDVVINVDKHTTICTNILYDDDGKVAFIEISEAVYPLVRRKLWNPEEFYEHFAEYRLCRYDYLADVPAPETVSVQGSYALMPRNGDRHNYKLSTKTKGVVDVLESGYHKAVIKRDGVIVNTITLNGKNQFEFDCSVAGLLEMYLEKNDGTKSGSVYAQVVKSSVSVIDASFAPTNDERVAIGTLTVEFDATSGTPLYVQVGVYQIIYCNIVGKVGTAQITFDYSKLTSLDVRVAYQNEFGVYLSKWKEFTLKAQNKSTDTLLSQGEYYDGLVLSSTTYETLVQANKVGYFCYTMVPVQANQTYYSLGANRIWYLDAEGNPISTDNISKKDYQFTVPENAAYVSITYSSAKVEKGTESIVLVQP